MARILIIDDRAVNRQFLATLLGYAGHELLEAASGEEALRQVLEARPDLVITDILMPHMDGYEFVQRLRANPAVAATPVIFHTATYSAPEAEKLARSIGVKTILPKPCEPEALLAAVNEALGTKAPGPSPGALQGPRPGGQFEEIRRIDDSFGLRVDELRGSERRLEALALRAERDGTATAAKSFLDSLSGVQRTASQLSAVIEIGMQAARERDPARLMELFADGARKIVRAEIVAIGLFGGEGDAPRVVARGVEPRFFAGEGRGGRGVLSSLFAAPRVLRGGPIAGLPVGLPPVRNAFALPVAAQGEVLGWMLFANRVDAEGFSADDERIAAVVAAEFAQQYERAAMYDVIQRHAAALQLEAVERKRAEARVRRLNRVYAVLSGINSAIVRIRSRDELYAEACRIVVEEGEFLFAWIGVADPAAETLVLEAWRGKDDGLVDAIRSRLPLQSGSIVAQALTGNTVVVCNDIASDARIGIREVLLRHGTGSIVVLPIAVAGKAAGALTLHAAEPGFFDAEELRLLRELASDVGFALDHIAKIETLDYLAYYDQITGLANRRLFVERLDQYILGAGPSGAKLALVVADLERWRTVNESFGRQAGDTLLKHLAERLAARATHGELARLGADQFAIVLRDVKGRSEVIRRVQRLWSEWLGQPYQLGENELRLSAKAGIALFPSDGTNAETLLRDAEAALREAKRTGEPHLFHAREMTADTAERLTLENRLRRALENGELVLHYQPRIDLASRTIAGLEALIRWQSPDLGLVPPAQFIPLMEETGLILDVGRWALERAAADQARWRAGDGAAPRVSVNVSAIQLRKRDFVADVAAALRAGVGAAAIDLEITESLIMENVEDSIRKLKQVRELGVEIAIDDFGTGYSSLGYLTKLPVQALKIDRSFIDAMVTDPDATTLVQTIISLAHSLKLIVVAEGVETEEQAHLLRLLRCDQMQGYLYSRPVARERIGDLLRAAAP